MIPDTELPVRPLGNRLSATQQTNGSAHVGPRTVLGKRMRSDGTRLRILVVEDERSIRDSLSGLLEEEGYEVVTADNGQEGLRRLRRETPPDIIVLDLRMPVMDGWEFRAIQKDDPDLGTIPVVAISADGSAQAVTISAQAYLRKPLDVGELLRTIDRILFESDWRRLSSRLEEAERLASLGRLAAGVGHEINNPLAFALLNLGEALDRLRPLVAAEQPAASPPAPDADRNEDKPPLAGITEMLEDCQVGLERIRQTVGNLQRLSRSEAEHRGSINLREVIEQAISMAWNQIRHRARLIREFEDIPPVTGNAAALGQVFLNLLINAAQSIPEGDADQNAIAISTTLRDGEVVVEVHDTGQGIAPEVLPHVFEPFFTTKPMGLGTGLGLSISRQTVTAHGGRMEVDSEQGEGTVFRICLPPDRDLGPVVVPIASTAALPRSLSRGRILVVDDEPMIGRVIKAALSDEHDVFVAQRATEAFDRFAADEAFDVVLCDVVMPDITGPDVYSTISERWPRLLPGLVFMTGGAFTPATAAFIQRNLTPVLAKPFDIDELVKVIREHVRGYQ